MIEKCQAYLQDTLGYSVENTELELRPQEEFVECGGIYLPRNRTAVVPSNSPLVLFHEYFGHGLFCEKSQTGKRLVDLEQELLADEKKEFEGRHFSEGDLQEFRESNPIFGQLQQWLGRHVELYEAFAIWSEYNLARVNDIELPKRRIESIEDFQSQFGDLATFYEFGLEMVKSPPHSSNETFIELKWGDLICDKN